MNGRQHVCTLATIVWVFASTTLSAAPTPAPVVSANMKSDSLLTFCVIADVPYTDEEKESLPDQLMNEMDGCEFLVHLGDIFETIDDVPSCVEDGYISMAELLLLSKVPTFIIPGDNEWNDCGNYRQISIAWSFWQEHLMGFENNWNHTLSVTRQFDYPENFYIMRKRTLIFGLNIVGGRIHDEEEWQERLSTSVAWVKTIVGINVPLNADGIIILGHASPRPEHDAFFVPLQSFVEDELQNRVPIMYMHGDGHKYIYTQEYLGVQNFLRVQHEGGVRNPVLKVLADPYRNGPKVYDSFQIDRQFW